MKKTCAAVLAISMAILWAWGCQEEQVSSDVKQSRLIAAENGDLKTQLQQETKKRDDEIKNLKTQLQTEKEKLNADMNNLFGGICGPHPFTRFKIKKLPTLHFVF